MKTLILCLILPALAVADDARERRVKVALALAGTCGKCATDETFCRQEAARRGVPLVLFVGDSCGKCGDAVREAGGVSCIVEQYDGDGRPATERRAVVLAPKADKTGWTIEGTYPPSEEKVRAAVSKAGGVMKVTGKPLNWDLR